MSEHDEDLRAIFRKVAEGAQLRPGSEGELLVAVRRRRLVTALGATLSVLLLVGGIAGASLLWDPDPDPVPSAHSDCQGTAYDVAVFPHDSTTADELEVMRQALLADGDVEGATFVSKAAAFEEFKEHYADQPKFWENLPEDALPASFRVTLVESAGAGEAAKRFQELPKVKDVRTAESLERSRPSPGSDSAPNCREQPDPSSMTVTELATSLFIDEELIDAVPTGFTVDQIVRNGPEDTNDDYATVGVRMSGPVDYARVIFFVHPDDAAAVAMYERELATARSYLRQARAVGETKGLRPYVVLNAAPGTRCGTGIDQLVACHALRGRVVMLTQSSGGRLGSRAEASEAELEAAETLARSFSSYLIEVYPEPEEESVPATTSARYSFESLQEDASVSGVMEVNARKATICFEARLSNNIVTAHVLDRQDDDAERVTLVVGDPPSRPDPSPEDPSALPAQPSTYCRLRVSRDLLREVIRDPERFVLNFRRGPSDDPGVVAELLELPGPEQERSNYYVDEQRGFGVRLPQGWEVARRSLTPNLDDPREILSLGTAPMAPGGNCAQQPVRALEALGPKDAFIAVQERRGEAGHPTRPRSFRERLEDRFYNIDLCTDVDDFRPFLFAFSDAGRDFHLLAALGIDASAQRTREFWQVLDSLDFKPPYDQD